MSLTRLLRSPLGLGVLLLPGTPGAGAPSLTYWPASDRTTHEGKGKNLAPFSPRAGHSDTENQSPSFSWTEARDWPSASPRPPRLAQLWVPGKQGVTHSRCGCGRRQMCRMGRCGIVQGLGDILVKAVRGLNNPEYLTLPQFEAQMVLWPVLAVKEPLSLRDAAENLTPGHWWLKFASQ